MERRAAFHPACPSTVAPMRTIREIITIASLLTFATAQAASWALAGKSDDGKAKDLVDVSSIKIDGAIRRARLRIVYAQHAQRGIGENAYKWLSHELISESFDCGHGSGRVEARTVYYEDGSDNSVVTEALHAYPTAWKPIGPRSHPESDFMHFVCTWKPK